MTFIILTPALACPSLSKKDDPVEVLLLAQSTKVRDDLSQITYSPWKSEKEKSIDKKDIEVIPCVSSDYHISRYVVSVYRKKGFTELVRAKIKISEKKGLYKFKNPFPEDVEGIIRTFKPSSFSDGDPVEVYHPFYIGEKDYLTIAHVSDSHLAARMEMLEKRWNTNFKNVWHVSTLSKEKPGDFSNYNKQFESILKTINRDKTIDMIIHTGDITDYNKGHLSPEGENDLTRDYYPDRNWLLFYRLLVKYYEKPFFSVLGNHDYRLNPYSPNPHIISRRIREFFNMAPHVNLTRSEMNTLHEDPHALHVMKNHIRKAPYAVRWYSFVINPLLDYEVFYGNMAFLMLDWNLGEDHEEGNPWAEKVLSQRQWKMLRLWYDRVLNRRKTKEKKEKKRIIAVVAMHSSVFNPFPETGDSLLMSNPDTRIFYQSLLIDNYTPERDLVDGTFRLRRNEFIKVCLGNRRYEESYQVHPERDIDLILTGHAHRTGIFQVEGPHVYLRDANSLKKGPIFCNAISSGPLGIKNKEGGPERIELSPPGYHVIDIDDDISITVYHSSIVPVREDARCSFGEVARGEFFEVLDTVMERPLFDPVYSWQITNLKEGSTLTKIVIETGLTRSVEVKKVPLGWRYNVDVRSKCTYIVCEAHDRGQGIYFESSGDITIAVDGESAERVGTLTVNWDMGKSTSPPVHVRVPSD